MNYAVAGNGSILLVDDDPTVAAALSGVLREFGRVRYARSGSEALRLAHESVTDLVLLDINLPDLSGFEICKSLKHSAELSDVAIIFITSDAEQEVEGLSCGAVDFITKPPRPAQVAARVRIHLCMRQMHMLLRLSAATDPLTGLANRRAFDEALQREWLRCQRMASPIAIASVDVDHFKAYNDHYGHPAGDECLRAVSQALRKAARRPADVLARCGGEEFAILLPDTDAYGACCAVERALSAVAGLKLAHARSTTAEYLTVSAGVTAYDPSCDNWGMPQRNSGSGLAQQLAPTADLVATCDRALYAAKQGGRNHARFLSLNDRETAERAVDLRNRGAWPPQAAPTRGTRS